MLILLLLVYSLGGILDYGGFVRVALASAVASTLALSGLLMVIVACVRVEVGLCFVACEFLLSIAVLSVVKVKSVEGCSVFVLICFGKFRVRSEI